MNQKAKRRPLRMVALIIFAIIIILAAIAGVYCYRCINYWQTDHRKAAESGFVENQAVLPDGSVINYAIGPDNGPALLLIHGQTGAWEDYERVLPTLSQTFQVFAVDCYGHGGSSHDEQKYYVAENGDDLIWFVDEIIQKKTVVSGHSSGGLLAAYVAAYGGDNIVGAVLEDPPVFSTEATFFERSFAYQDTYKNMHEYLKSEQTECWEAYYMRHCLWGQLYMASAMNGLANYAQHYHENNPGKPVQYFFMPESVNFTFLYVGEYDMQFGEHFCDYSWHSGISHKQLMSDIEVPTVFIHAKDQYSEDGILMAASSDEQAREAVALIGDCALIELESNHDIHRFNADTFVNTFSRFQESTLQMR